MDQAASVMGKAFRVEILQNFHVIPMETRASYSPDNITQPDLLQLDRALVKTHLNTVFSSGHHTSTKIYWIWMSAARNTTRVPRVRSSARVGAFPRRIHKLGLFSTACRRFKGDCILKGNFG